MSPTTNGKPSNILLIEDNPGDARLVREALREFKHPVELHHVKDAITALQFLQKDGPYKNAPRPRLILLDLNMPRKDGREMLRDIRNDPNSASIPVIVLTTSGAEHDVDLCYAAGANCYLRKPVDVTEFIDLMKMIESFWLGLALTPTP
ncbi:response regulator [Thalassospira lucentensis]|uniref:response regulator n=1 Tax=Thalassospira lucentensis TaxID=168935 RepID=UPI00142E71CA|nr:response regulator [Thalassospira lucentensis]NIZ03897.1 response regulator [Thalassospira lucentensis]